MNGTFDRIGRQRGISRVKLVLGILPALAAAAAGAFYLRQPPPDETVVSLQTSARSLVAGIVRKHHSEPGDLEGMDLVDMAVKDGLIKSGGPIRVIDANAGKVVHSYGGDIHFRGTATAINLVFAKLPKTACVHLGQTDELGTSLIGANVEKVHVTRKMGDPLTTLKPPVSYADLSRFCRETGHLVISFKG